MTVAMSSGFSEFVHDSAVMFSRMWDVNFFEILPLVYEFHRLQPAAAPSPFGYSLDHLRRPVQSLLKD